MIIWILLIILGINLFLAGRFFEDTFVWEEEKLKVFLGTFLIIIGGVPLLILASVKFLYKKLENYFMLKFWVKFLFTKEFDNLKEERLERLNQLSDKLGNTLKDKIFKKAVNCANKRNKYLPNTTKTT